MPLYDEQAYDEHMALPFMLAWEHPESGSVEVIVSGPLTYGGGNQGLGAKATCPV